MALRTAELMAFMFVLCATSVTPVQHDLSKIDILNETSFLGFRPNATGIPVIVYCDFFIQSFGSINEADLDFQIVIYFRMRWRDDRLRFNPNEPPILVQTADMDRLWIPDIYFPNEKTASHHNVVRPNRNVMIYPNGTVFYSSRLSLRLSCPMDLSHYPLDYQDCHIKISIYSYSMEHVQLEWWDDDPVEVDMNRLVLPQFELLNTTATKCEEKYKTGEFACLSAGFHMKRQLGFYILQVYLPSILIIVLSWLSFWVNKEAVPARITLGVTTVLTMTTQLGSSKSASMKVSYPKAIDFWFSMCMLLVFGALLEYVLVNVRWRHEQKSTSAKKAARKNLHTASTNEMETMMELDTSEAIQCKVANRRRDEHRVVTWCRNRASRPISADDVDKFSRVFFPGIFLIFNIVYWIFYSYHTNHSHSNWF